MNTLRRIVTIFIIAVTVIATPVYAAIDRSDGSTNDDPRFDTNAPPAYAMAGDLVIARPLGAVVTVIGTGIFLVTLPFSALGGNVGEAANALVVTPARETFVRCLGCTKPRVFGTSSNE